jgi:hypothetical protein
VQSAEARACARCAWRAPSRWPRGCPRPTRCCAWPRCSGNGLMRSRPGARRSEFGSGRRGPRACGAGIPRRCVAGSGGAGAETAMTDPPPMADPEILPMTAPDPLWIAAGAVALVVLLTPLGSVPRSCPRAYAVHRSSASGATTAHALAPGVRPQVAADRAGGGAKLPVQEQVLRPASGQVLHTRDNVRTRRSPPCCSTRWCTRPAPSYEVAVICRQALREAVRGGPAQRSSAP